MSSLSRYIVVALLLVGAIYLGSRQFPRRSNTSADIADSEQRETANSDEQSATVQLELYPNLVDRQYDSAIRGIVEREDPVLDGWQTERFNELVDVQLKKIGKLLSNPKNITALDETLCTNQFAGTLRPVHLEPTYSDTRFEIRRAGKNTTAPSNPSTGTVAFKKALQDQARVFAGEVIHLKFKTIRVELKDGFASTSSYFQMNGRPAPEHAVQVNSTWNCIWSIQDPDKPVLNSVEVRDYEEVRKSGTEGFADCTESALQGISALNDQLIFGRDHWYSTLEGSIGVEGRGNGIAIGDVNGDGLDDIYLCQPSALPNLLLVRQSDGSLKNISVEAGVNWLDSSRGALIIDLDNDGDQDLVVALNSQLAIHQNKGEGDFELQKIIPTVSRLFSLNAIDYDSDGDLDLFACGYSGVSQIRPDDIFASPVPYHDANNGAPNFLFRNEGNLTFADVTDASGLNTNNLRFSLASVWDDFNNDGQQDLYVANDFGRNNLYQFDGTRFVDIAEEAGVQDIGPGMSAATGDQNNDGRVDLYVSNMFSSAGSRITHNPKFKDEASQSDLKGFRRHARGNSLFNNLSKNRFVDAGESSGTLMGRWAWGSQFVDINHDGWQDIYVTNGFVTADNNNDL